MSASGAEIVVGVLLLFFVPGYALTKATFPEWRIRGGVAVLRLVEVATLSFVTSVALTVLTGYLLLAAIPGGFQAYWSDPILEAILAAVASVGLVVGWVRGAFAREPPRPVSPEPVDEGGTWPLVQRLETLRREERRLRHGLRRAASDSPEARRLRDELEQVQDASTSLRADREEEYAG